MKRLFFTLAIILFVGYFADAQNHNTLWCDKDMKLKNTHHFMLQKTTEPGKLNAKMKWGAPNGSATFSAANLEITNGTCESCKPLGAIGSGNYEQNWVIKVTDPSKPVTFAWKTAGTINVCGTGKLVVPKPF
jgi:hypothetical protein